MTKKKAYFVAPPTKNKDYKNFYRKVSEHLKQNNINVHSEIVDTSGDPGKHFAKIEVLIRNCDIFIAELSEPNASIGYEIGYAIANSKPVLVLRHKDSIGELGTAFTANPRKLVNIGEYDNDKSLKNEIEKFIRKASKDVFVKRLPIEFTQKQIEYVEEIKRKYSQRSFNSTVRFIIEESLGNNSL